MTVKSWVRLPGDIIFRLRLHQHPESLRTKFEQHGSIKFSPEVVNSLGTPRSAERPGSIIPDQPSIRNGQVDRMRKGRQRGPTVGERVKCRMKCFYETRSPGLQDQDFDAILIWRLYLPTVEPGISRRSGNSTGQWPWNPGFDSREI